MLPCDPPPTLLTLERECFGRGGAFRFAALVGLSSKSPGRGRAASELDRDANILGGGTGVSESRRSGGVEVFWPTPSGSSSDDDLSFVRDVGDSDGLVVVAWSGFTTALTSG